MNKLFIGLGTLVSVAVVAGIIGFMGMFTVNSGHVAVGTMFGEVQDTVYDEGLHWANPIMIMRHYDAREKTMKVTLEVPSADQLSTTFDISIQYRLIGSLTPTMIRETGSPQAVIDTHMLPLFASKTREIGKSVETAEEFYKQTVQQRVQSELLTSLATLNTKGIKVEKLLVRNVKLPDIITDAVMRKKTAAQEAEKAKETLKKFIVDQNMKDEEAKATKKALITKANGRLEAAKIDAKATLVKAEAQAKAKKKQIAVVGLNGYIQLESLKTLEAFQGGNHMIIMDSENTSPLPFLNLNKIK